MGRPAALTEYGTREATEPWVWAGPERSVTGQTWGGCAEVIQWILTAGRFPVDPSVLNGGVVLLLETSEELIPAREFGWIMRSLGERGVLAAVDAIILARPPAEQIDTTRTSTERRAHRVEQCDTALEIAHRYNPDAVVCFGPPFGHTRPQWIVPYGGAMTIDGTLRRVWPTTADNHNQRLHQNHETRQTLLGPDCRAGSCAQPVTSGRDRAPSTARRTIRPTLVLR